MTLPDHAAIRPDWVQNFAPKLISRHCVNAYRCPGAALRLATPRRRSCARLRTPSASERIAALRDTTNGWIVDGHLTESLARIALAAMRDLGFTHVWRNEQLPV